jgi:hypothetical protein
MKIKLISTIALLFFGIVAFAQNNMEDVIYLKNGSIYRGLIIEQIPNESFKIKIAGGSVMAVSVSEIQKITKEETPKSNNDSESFRDREYGWGYGYRYHNRDTSRTPLYLKNRGFFRSVEFRPGINNIGIRFVRGFKFNRFAHFGLGLGFDGVYFGNGISWGKGVYDNTNVNNGLYIPLYFQLSGDMLKARVTPYYLLEAGYAFHPANPFARKNPVSKSWGGPIATAGFGVKFYSKRKSYAAMNINATYRSDIYRTRITEIDEFGNETTRRERGIKNRVFGSLGFVIGF